MEKAVGERWVKRGVKRWVERGVKICGVGQWRYLSEDMVERWIERVVERRGNYRTVE